MFPETFPSFVYFILLSSLSSVDMFVHNPEVKTKLTSQPIKVVSSYNNDYVFKDVSYCPPCLCFNNMDYILTTDCTNRRLKDVPVGLPVSITSLDMSYNNLYQFNTASVSNYSWMTYLVVHFNSHLTEVTHISMVNSLSQLTRLDLSHNNISSIRNGSFLNHRNLQELMLVANKLMNISADMFEGLHNLNTLSLSNNLISHIDSNTFNFLNSLQFLDLSENNLAKTKNSFPAGIFQNLGKLKHLYLQGNLNSDQPYPIEALSRLSQLTHLYLGLNKFSQLDTRVKSLKFLKTLFFGGSIGSCNIRNITDDFLENTPYLTTLVINGCNLFYISPFVYASVKNLETLQISRTSENYDLYKGFDHLQGLVNSSLKILRMISMAQYLTVFQMVGKEQAQYLQYIELEELDISCNSINVVCPDFAELLPKTLKRLVLNDNKLTLKVFKLMNIYFLSELSEIYLDRQVDYTHYNQVSSVNDVPQIYKPSKNSTGIKSTGTAEVMRKLTLDNKVHALIKTKFSPNKLCPGAQLFVTKRKIYKVPPKLKVVQASRFNFFDMFIFQKYLTVNNSLTDVTMSNNIFKKWGDGVLPHNLRRADLSNNFALMLKTNFFQPNNSLIILHINNNILGQCFAADINGNIFTRATNLRILDISTNLITTLHRPFFSGLKLLEILLASNNKLQILNVSLSHMTNLLFLNFSQNSITWIDQTTRDDLDILASTHTVYLDLSFNPLPCTCEGLPVLQWMAYTNVNLVNQIYLKCKSEDETISDIGNLIERVGQVQRSCSSRTIILLISISLSAFIALFISLALVYRFRWKIRYLRNIALAKIAGFKPKIITGDVFQYDAYIVYDDELLNSILTDFVQELEVKRGHRLLLTDRDLMPGTFMTSAILSAVQNSYKTIPVVTPDFYDGVYSEYAVKMAMMEEIYGQRQILHLCLYQPTDPEEMSKDLLTIMHRNHYTEYPPEQDRTEDLVEHFWDQLSRCIQQKI